MMNKEETKTYFIQDVESGLLTFIDANSEKEAMEIAKKRQKDLNGKKRRPLTIIERAEIGLILLEEEEKKAKERMSKIKAELGKARKGKEKDEPLSESQKKDLEVKIKKIKEEFGEGQSTKIVAQKVRISHGSLSKAKKIKEFAKKYKSIAKRWEDAKKGKTSIDAIYKKVKIKEEKEIKMREIGKKIANKFSFGEIYVASKNIFDQPKILSFMNENYKDFINDIDCIIVMAYRISREYLLIN